MAVLREYHAALGDLVFRFEGTLERFTGDGLMVFFNDPLPCPDAPARAVRMAVAMRRSVGDIALGWRRRATCSASASESRRVTRRSARRFRGALRLRGDRDSHEPRSASLRGCDDGQILVSERVLAAVEEFVAAEEMHALTPKGFVRPVIAHNVVGLDGAM